MKTNEEYAADEKTIENSGSRVFHTNNSALRNRQGQQSNPSVQSIVNNQSFNTNRNRHKMQIFGRRSCFLIFLTVVIAIFLFYLFKHEEITENTETLAMNQYRAIFLNLGAVLNNSDVIVENGAQIARVLSELSDDFKKVISNFNTIKTIKNGLTDHSKNAHHEKFINELEVSIEKVHHVIGDLQKTVERLTHTQQYLMTGEKEAQKVLNNGGSVNYEKLKRAGDERNEVLFVLKILKSILPDFLDFESFLDGYKSRLQDILSKFKYNYAKLEPSESVLKQLIRDAEKLETIHKNYIMKEKQLGQSTKDKMNEYQDCTGFYIKFTKSDGVYLEKLSIWHSHLINAVAFFYSDNSVEMFGTPESDKSFEFEWHKDEKIKCFTLNFATVIYGFEIITTKGRSTGWIGSKSGHRSDEMKGREFDGLFGSSSKYICSLGTIS